MISKKKVMKLIDFHISIGKVVIRFHDNNRCS